MLTAGELLVIEDLIELLVASPDVERALPAAVARLVHAIGRDRGALFILPRNPTQAPRLITHHPPPTWTGWLRQPAAPLRQRIEHALHTGQMPAPDPALELAAMVPVASPARRVGVLLVAGLPCSAHEIERLTYLARFVGQAIQQHQWREAGREEVARSRSTLLALFDGIPNPLYIVDRDYRLVAVNKACARRADAGSASFTPPDLVGRFCYAVLHRRRAPCDHCRVAETFASGQSTWRPLRRDETAPASDWEISTYPIRDERGETQQVILFEQDVTEKRRLEASLLQSEKLAAVGQLAAGVAHEINNPLTAVLANAQLLQRDLPEDSDWRESTELIIRAGERALRVVRNLLDSAREERYVLAPVDINASLAGAVAFAQHRLLGGGVTLVRDFAPALPTVCASADHLHSVWLNLLLNACDALEGVADGQIRLATLLHGKAVRVVVSDNGAGIPPEQLSRIFEPFYTTKAPGCGTGLGLSICHRIIQQHGGDIQVESQVGKGTTVIVALPVGAA